MAKSPTVQVAITPERYERAVQSASGGCLIADGIKEQGYTGVRVDMATIRFTDRKEGKRYTYLTPSTAQELLLAFDQGWPNPTERVTIQRAVKIETVVKSKGRNQSREERRAELEAKIAAGEELTRGEKTALAKLRESPSRPSEKGRSRVDSDGTVVGGRELKQGPAHPNLLRSRNRHFGAKLSHPGQVFTMAVEEEVARRLQQGH